MALTTQIKSGINAVLSLANLRIETLTADRIEAARLAALVAEGHFTRPAFPILPQFVKCEPASIIKSIHRYKEDLRRFEQMDRNGYVFANEYFTSPDAEVAYAIARVLRPKRIVEIGAGNSTKLFREAINDSHMPTELIAIDPQPRRAIETVADRIIQSPVEQIALCYFQELQTNDILFIDSSHCISIANDVVRLVLEIIPSLAEGVVIHFHDVFLPYDYPKEWIVDYKRNWNEQYLIQALLQDSNDFEVLWPGHFLEKTRPKLAQCFNCNLPGVASSLWLRKVGQNHT